MVFKNLKEQLQVLNNLIFQLSAEQYREVIKHLGNASIGGHSRHIIELLACAVNGYETGVIDYENRTRNLVLNDNIDAAKQAIQVLINTVEKTDKPLQIVVDINTSYTVASNYFREIVYNIEHTIHHLALIKVALIDMNLNIVNENFGVAQSTINYKNEMRLNKTY